jgi:hypothetical protein
MKRSFRLSDSKPDPRRDVSDELRFHIEMRTQEFIEQGMSAEDARRAALAAFGDVGEIEAEVRGERAQVVRLAESVPTILLTGQPWASEEMAEELGLVAVVRKPFSLSELCLGVTQTLRDWTRATTV